MPRVVAKELSEHVIAEVEDWMRRFLKSKAVCCHWWTACDSA